ncbi:MAG: glycoside hydrolase [Clostridia bacterium]|nr:glycoside hydrolase [Clostridia bacterium]
MKAIQHSIQYDRKTGQAAHFESEASCLPENQFPHIVEDHVIGLYPSFRFQKVDGFGCALTETACYLLSQMSPEQRTETLSFWFGPEENKARFVRIPIDSCDYSLSEYQAVADPIADPELNTFSIDRDRKYILPVVKEALTLSGGKLSVLLSPWSPPWQWKTPPQGQKNDAVTYGGQEVTEESLTPSRNNGGSLKPEFYGSWAKYLVKFIQAYLAEGIPVTMLSVQNEAAAATPWDSCVWTCAQEKDFLRGHLYPALRDAGLAERLEIFVWDHNKERMVERIEEMMDPEIEPLISGFAYHWYTGDHFDALALLRGKYPQKVLMHSESCPLHMPGRVTFAEMDLEALKKKPRASLAPEEAMILDSVGDKTPADVDLEDAFAYAHDIIGDLNSGMNRWIDWNLIVDPNGGPRHVAGGFAAPLVYGADGKVIRTVTFEYLSLIMDAIPSGSVRIGCSSYGAEVEAVAVSSPDEKEIRVLLFQRGNKKTTVNLRLAEQVISVELPPESLTSVRVKDLIG